ncbi:unnamed protein product [Polarella glacialis]|uniref:Uncharacterized protein n=1 Tax=Polarella glacialis TaxID=89957 RepID=A0A813DR10_POLGL|nr:unnamed protein product [Polarella glacialis]
MSLSCKELRALLLPASQGSSHSQQASASVLGLECSLSRPGDRAAGTASASATLRGLEVSLGPRLLVAPRYANLPLFKLQLAANPTGTMNSGGGSLLNMTWAQIALVYRQRDLDELMKLVQQEFFAALSHESHGADSATQAATSADIHTSTAARGTGTQNGRGSLQYSLQVDAPLIFLPAGPGERGSGHRPKSSQSVGGLTVVPSDASSACRTFLPLHGEGFIVLDLGTISVASERGLAIEMALRNLRVLSVAAQGLHDAELKEELWHEVLGPVSAKVVLNSGPESLDICMSVPLGNPSGSEADHTKALHAGGAPDKCIRVGLTRAQATQMLDVMFLNLSYASADELGLRAGASASDQFKFSPPAREKGTKSDSEGLGTSPNKEPVARRAFKFRLEWLGAFYLHAKFTDEAPLAQLELEDGSITYSSDASCGELQMCCRSGCVKDSRTRTRSTQLLLIELPPPKDTGEFGLMIVSSSSTDQSAPGQFSVRLLQPKVWLLPQAWMDLLTWCLSIMQQTAQSKAQYVAAEVDDSSAARALAMTVEVRDAAVRFPIAWASAEEHFAISGDICVSMLSQPTGVTRLERFALLRGRLVRVSGTECEGTVARRLLCSHFEFLASGSSERLLVGGAAGDWVSCWTMDVIRLSPLQLQLALSDQAELSEALSALAAMEADSAESAGELRLRDPLAFVTRQRYAITGSLDLEGVELQVVDALRRSGGTGAAAGTSLVMRPILELAFGCPLLLLSVAGVRGEAITGSTRTEHFWLRMRSLNERLGSWEPVLELSTWHLDCVARPAGTLPTDGVLEIHAAPCKPLQLVVTVTFVHLCARLLQDTTAAARARSHTSADLAKGWARSRAQPHGLELHCYFGRQWQQQQLRQQRPGEPNRGSSAGVGSHRCPGQDCGRCWFSG